MFRVFLCLFLCLVCCCKKAMLGYLPHCADNGCEPTSVAFMYKEESMHRLVVLQIFPPELVNDVLISSLLINYIFECWEMLKYHGK